MTDQEQLEITTTPTEPRAELRVASWLETLPPEIKSAQSLSKFKDIASLAQSYLEAEKALNKRVSIPAPESPQEEWQKFYQKLGLPEDKKYTDQRSAEDEPYLQAYEEMFYQSGLSKKQGEQLMRSLQEYSSKLHKDQQDELAKLRETNLSWLKNYYADDFDSKMPLMQAALQKFGSKELASLLEESNYAPPLIDLLVKVGDTLQSDGLITGSEKPSITGDKAALAEIKRLESDEEFMVKLHDKHHPAHDEAVKRMQELYNLAYTRSI